MRATCFTVDEVVPCHTAHITYRGRMTAGRAVHRFGTVKVELPQLGDDFVGNPIGPVDIENQQPVSETLREERVSYGIVCSDIGDQILNSTLSIAHSGEIPSFESK